MTLRPDEKFVKRCLVKTLKSSKAYEGENPPDIYLELNGEKIAIEITRLSPVSFDRKGIIQNRKSQDYYGLNLCDDLDLSLRNKILPDIDILLTLYVPVEQGRKFKRELRAFVERTICGNVKIGDKQEIEICGSKVKISIIPNRDYSDKKIVGIIINKNANPHIFSNAQIILADRIQDKNKKCKKIIEKGGKVWLALFNDYWLADHETYANALSTIDMAHGFDRIYVIMDNGEVSQIY